MAWCSENHLAFSKCNTLSIKMRKKRAILLYFSLVVKFLNSELFREFTFSSLSLKHEIILNKLTFPL